MNNIVEVKTVAKVLKEIPNPIAKGCVLKATQRAVARLASF